MTLSDKQLRQFNGYGIAQIDNAIEALQTTRAHLTKMDASLTERIDGPQPEPAPDPAPEPTPEPEPLPDDPVPTPMPPEYVPPPVVSFGEVEGMVDATDPTVPWQDKRQYTLRRTDLTPPPMPDPAQVEAAKSAGIIPDFIPLGVPVHSAKPGYVYDPDAHGVSGDAWQTHPFPYITRAMGGTGWRPDIGFATGHCAAYLADPTDPEKWAAAASQADGFLSIPWHLYDPATGRPALWLTSPKYAGLWAHPAHGGRADCFDLPQGPDIVDPDSAHTPCCVSLLGIVTGERRWLVAGVAQAAFHLASQNPGNRQGQPIWSWNARILWWSMRDLGLGWLCAKALGWAEHVVEFDKALRRMAAWMEAERKRPHLALYGVLDVDWGSGGIDPAWGQCMLMSPWQADMGPGVVAWLVRMGREEFRPILDYLVGGIGLRTRAQREIMARYGSPVAGCYRFPVTKRGSYAPPEKKGIGDVESYQWPQTRDEIVAMWLEYDSLASQIAYANRAFNDWSQQSLAALALAEQAGCADAKPIREEWEAARAWWFAKAGTLNLHQQYCIAP